MNKDAYTKIIKQDIEWLKNNSEPTLEREHIVSVLNETIDKFYPEITSETLTFGDILSGHQEGRFISREEIDRVFVAQRCYVPKEDIDKQFRRLNGQEILKKYEFTKKQIEWIKNCLSEYNPQTEFFEDLIYGMPSQNCGGFVITVMEGRDDVVGIYCGKYDDGLYYYSPVINGKFESPKPIHGEIIGIIPFKK